MLLDPPLRRVNDMTMVTAAAQAGLAVVVVQLAHPYQVKASTTAVLLSPMRAGNLLASLLLTARPLAGDPDRLTTRHIAVIGVCFGGCALAPSFWAAVAAFTLLGIATAPFVTATFAARNHYAPSRAGGQVGGGPTSRCAQNRCTVEGRRPPLAEARRGLQELYTQA